MKTRLVHWVAAAVLAAAGVAPASAANLVTNGDFETPGTPGQIPPGWSAIAFPSGPFNALNIGLYQGSDFIPCCNVGGSPAAMANHFAGFGVGESDNLGGGLFQNLATNAGRSYIMSFDLAAIGTAGAPQHFAVGVFDMVSASLLTLNEYTVLGNNNLDFTFTPYGFTFTAGSATTALLFSNLSPTASIDGAVDNVSVTVSAVPEPSTWALLVVGLVGLTAVARKRSGSTA